MPQRSASGDFYNTARAFLREQDGETERALDLALWDYAAWCPRHGGFDPDQRGPGWCPYCVADGSYA